MKNKKVNTRYLAEAQPITSSNPVRENKQINTDLAKWVKFYKENNIYINDLFLRAKRSATHGAILTDKLTYSYGNGIVFLKDGEEVKLNSAQEKWLKSMNAEGLTFNEVFYHLLRGFIYSGNAYLQIVESKGVMSLFKQDPTQVRVAKDFSKAFISSFWRDIKSADHWNNKLYPVFEIDSYKGKGTSKPQMMHFKNDIEESDYYGLPDHIGALKWADIEYRIPTHNLTKFDNGFFPSALITLVGAPPQGMTAQEYINKMRNQFTGEEANDKLTVELVDTPEQKAMIHEFKSEKDGEFKDLQELAVQNIVSAHRWDVNLSGIQTPGKLGSSKEIEVAYERVLNTVINGYRNETLRWMKQNILVKTNLFEGLEMGVSNIKPTSLRSDINKNRVLTVNDGRGMLGYEPLSGEIGNTIIDAVIMQEIGDNQLDVQKKSKNNNQNGG